MNRTIFRPLLLGLALAGGIMLAGGEAQAAPEDAVCRGVAPAVGQVLKGPILHVVDGERMCVALDATPDSWVEVQVLDAPLQKTSAAPRARGALMAAAFAQNAVCEVKGVAGGVALAECQIEGQPLAQRLATPDIVKVGQAWR